MLIAYWIIAGLLTLVFLAAGIMKTLRPRDQLIAAGMTYVEDLTTTQIRLIGIAEFLGALGLTLPLSTGIATVLSPIGGIGLAALMIGAVITHVRRHESFLIPLVLGVLSIAAAALGFLVQA